MPRVPSERPSSLYLSRERRHPARYPQAGGTPTLPGLFRSRSQAGELILAEPVN